MIVRTAVSLLDWYAPRRLRALETIARHPYSRFPVAEGSLDRIRGVVDVRDICIAQRQSTQVDLATMARAPLFVPDRAATLELKYSTMRPAQDTSTAAELFKRLRFQCSVLGAAQGLQKALSVLQRPEKVSRFQ